MFKILIAFFLVAHGIVHLLLAYHPSRDEDEIVGGLWTHSWLLGDGRMTKQFIWIGSGVTTALYVFAGLSVIGILPHGWSDMSITVATIASLLVLLICWFGEFFPGMVIDVAILVLVWVVN